MRRMTLGFLASSVWPVISIITSVGTSVRDSTYDASIAKITASAIGTNR